MNAAKAKKLLPIIQAFADGKTIQVLHAGTQQWDELIASDFTGLEESYRIKPSPTYLDGHKASGLKVGDTVRIKARGTSDDLRGWDATWTEGMNKSIGLTGVITGDAGKSGFRTYIKGESFYQFPYTSLEKVEPKYRAFASAEEYKPHRDRWIRKPGINGRWRPSFHDNTGIRFGSVYMNYSELRDAGYEFDDDGSPCGVLITE